MKKDKFYFTGFTYPSNTSPIDEPDGAFITNNFFGGKKPDISKCFLTPIDISKFKELVRGGTIADISINSKDELTLKANRKSMRNSGLDTIGTAGSFAGQMGITSAITSAGATAGTTGVAAGIASAPFIVPLAASIAAGMGLSYTIKSLSGLVTKDKLYAYCCIRMLSEHVEYVDSHNKSIAVYIAGLNRSKNSCNVVMFLYGKSVGRYVRDLINEFPTLPGRASLTNGNATVMIVPIETLQSTDLELDYTLLYNTQLFHIEEFKKETVKKSKISVEEIDSLVDKLDSHPIDIKRDYVKEYCEKYNLSKEQFDMDSERLCSVLHCSADELQVSLKFLL